MFFSRDNLDAICKYGILSLFLAMLLFAPLAFGAVDEWAFLMVEGLGVGLFILWGVRLLLHPKPKLLWPPLTWIVLAFAIYAVFRYFTADIEYVARVEVLQVLLFAGLFLVIVNNLPGQDETQIISFSLIALATVISCFAVFQLVTHSDRVWNLHSDNVGRAGGTYISPNDLAGFLGMLMPLTLAYLVAGRAKIITRILLGYALAAMVAGLGVTFSRAGWVATAMGIFFVLVVLLCHRNHRWRALLMLLILLAGSGLFITKYLSKTIGFSQRVMNLDQNVPGVMDFETRFVLWQAAEQMWQDNFWMGVGPAHFDYRFSQYRPEIIQLRPNRAHNDYLNLLADWGTIGGVIVLAGMGVLIFSLIKIWPHVRRSEDDFGSGQSNRYAFFLGAAGGLFALAVHSTMDFNLHIPANALVGVTLLALLVSNIRFATAKNWFRIGWPGKMILTGLIGVVSVAFAIDEWRRGGETLWLARAERQEVFSTEKADSLKMAFRHEPHNFQTAYEIAECYRQQSFQGGQNFADLAKQALDWYAKAIKLDPYDANSYLRAGMCLDWTGQKPAAEKYYRDAETLDPNSYYTMAFIGWHYVQIGDYAAAEQYLMRSLYLMSDSPFVRDYLQICQEKLVEQASGKPALPFAY